MHDIVSRMNTNEVRARIIQYTSGDLARAPLAACDNARQTAHRRLMRAMPQRPNNPRNPQRDRLARDRRQRFVRRGIVPAATRPGERRRSRGRDASHLRRSSEMRHDVVFVRCLDGPRAANRECVEKCLQTSEIVEKHPTASESRRTIALSRLADSSFGR